MKTMLHKHVYSMIRNIVALTFIVSGCSGLIQVYFKCSYYTFHENSTKGQSWETSRLLCQTSSEGDLVSIEEEEERNFVKNVIKNLTAIKYFIGLKQDSEKWKWLSNRTTIDSFQGKSPWAPGQPSGTYRPDQSLNCATIYGNYRSYLGRFSDFSCRRRDRNSGHICERAVSCTKHERGTRLTKRIQVTPVHSTTRTSSQGQTSAHFKVFFRESWCMAVLKDSFKDFMDEIRELLVAKTSFDFDMPSLEDKVLKMIDEDLVLSKDQRRVLTDSYCASTAKKAIEQRLLGFLNCNSYHFPLYAKPGIT